jgi:hypothetical protein
MATLPEYIIEAVQQFVRNERQRSFCFLGKRSHRLMNQEDLLIVSLAKSDDIKMIRSRSRNSHLATYTDQDWYTFHEPTGYNTMSHTVVLTTPEVRDNVISNITVTVPFLDGSVQIRPAAAWLRETYDWDDGWAMKFSATQYEEQGMWWKGTSQVFRLFELPLEIREVIWAQVIGPVILPDIRNSRVVLGQGLSYGITKRVGRNRDRDIEKPNMTIMRVSKRVRYEALTVAHRDLFKRFRMFRNSEYSSTRVGPLHPASAIIGAIRSQAPHATFLRNVQLEMSAACYFTSIGILPTGATPFFPQRGSFHLSTLQSFKALQRLDFCFIGPKHPEAVCPWVIPNVNTLTNTNEHSCQKIWIDWFFTFAWNDLKALGRQGKLHITLSGCVKTSSKKHWELMLNGTGDTYTSIVNVAEKRIRLEKTTMGCIPCVCSTPCSRADAAKLKKFVWDESDIRRIEGLQEHIDNEYWSFKD